MDEQTIALLQLLEYGREEIENGGGICANDVFAQIESMDRTDE